MKATDRIAIAHLGLFVEQHGTQDAAAKKLGVTKQYVGMMLHGDRRITNKILSKLGLKRVTVKQETI